MGKFSMHLMPGLFKCTVKEEESHEENPDEFIMINLKQGSGPVKEIGFSQVISPGGRAQFNYNTFSKEKYIQIKCCSNSTVPPNIYLSFCVSKRACDWQLNLLNKLVSKSSHL